MRNHALLIAVAVAATGLATPIATANDTTFTYQGSLKDSGALAEGVYSMSFRLYSIDTGGSPLATFNAGEVVISGGVFSVDLDFGASHWNNADRWLEIVIDGTTIAPRQPVHRAPYAVSTRGIEVDSDGKVGLGGAPTGEMLTIRDEDANILLLSQGNRLGPKLIMRNTSISAAGTRHGNIVFDSGSQLASIAYAKPAFGTPGLQFSGATSTNMKIASTGLIGIGGELEPLTTLHVQNEDIGLMTTAFDQDDLVLEANDAVLGIYSSNGGSRGSALSFGEISAGSLTDKWSIGRNTMTGNSVLTFRYGTDDNWATNPALFNIETNGDVSVSAGGRLGVGTVNPQATLHVEGNARVDILEIVGADLAEKFPTSCDEPIEPGTVLEIDPGRPGHLRIASTPLSPLVVGVVSGANGLSAGTIMGNLPGSENHVPVALSGRVWVKCIATTRGIHPGDMLTTCATPGHAMPVLDTAGAQGAIIGKAMTELAHGETGLVLVLVNLQ